MAFTDRAALARDATFQDRVQVAYVKAAVNVGAEAASSQPSYDAYYRRAALSVQVLNNPSQFREPYTWAVIHNDAISDASSDSDIEWTVNSLWDAMAGVIEERPAEA